MALNGVYCKLVGRHGDEESPAEAKVEKKQLGRARVVSAADPAADKKEQKAEEKKDPFAKPHQSKYGNAKLWEMSKPELCHIILGILASIANGFDNPNNPHKPLASRLVASGTWPDDAHRPPLFRLRDAACGVGFH